MGVQDGGTDGAGCVAVLSDKDMGTEARCKEEVGPHQIVNLCIS